jgi:putative ATP-binding cassette transporter
MAETNAPRGKGSLWRSFVTIAQPYFFPGIRGGAWATLLLMTALLIFLFALLFMMVAGITWAAARTAPDLSTKVAPGLVSLIDGIVHSRAWLLVAAALALPAILFAAFSRQLKARRQAWTLLAVVLLLSLAVTGINVAFSYIGNYFTNALVSKNKDLAYLFVATYFGGFLVGIPTVAMYGYVQDYLGLRWREWLTGEFLKNYFTNRNYYEIEARGEIDNPDQRIMEDIRSFTRTSLAFLLILLGSLMDLISFSGILWSKSGIPWWAPGSRP